MKSINFFTTAIFISKGEKVLKSQGKKVLSGGKWETYIHALSKYLSFGVLNLFNTNSKDDGDCHLSSDCGQKSI